MSKALEWARGQLGRGEVSGANDGPYVADLLGEPKRLNWCAAFVLRAFERGAGTKLPGNFWLSRRVSNLEEALARAGWELPTGAALAPGDIVTFDREGGSGHVGIVDEPKPSGAYTAIEGNVSNRVSRVWHHPNAHRRAFRTPSEGI